jgi:FdhE protein
MSTSNVQPDPSMIGGISKAPFVFLPNPGRLFRDSASRYERLAEGERLAPYLQFLAGIARAQSNLSDLLYDMPLIPADVLERASISSMPAIDRSQFHDGAGMREVVRRFLPMLDDLVKPAPAQEALALVKSAGDDDLDWMVANVMADHLPSDSLAHHLYVAAGVQAYMAVTASRLVASKLVPVSMGVCPSCGGRPIGSMVIGFQGAEGARYAVCACCLTRWNEVRVKCLSCGSTKGVGYRSVESNGEDATVKAEVCDQCASWTKILYQNKNPSLDMMADDVASLGIDLLMANTEYRRAGYNPFLTGY